ncbi:MULTISPECIES: antibiotic biosynthesis monooxygenase family protein [Leisingera]|uniref:antibiotic biosynthesis monooxygenase family protein n=1 Tax=Leisingera TaxID=191028 RepID=UPI00042120F7|nr:MULTISPECIES: hypothetical protein [Leisingera]
MIAVIFEVEIAEGQKEVYLETAAALREQLDQVDRFVSVERFQSLSAPENLLSGGEDAPPCPFATAGAHWRAAPVRLKSMKHAPRPLGVAPRDARCHLPRRRRGRAQLLAGSVRTWNRRRESLACR